MPMTVTPSKSRGAVAALLRPGAALALALASSTGAWAQAQAQEAPAAPPVPAAASSFKWGLMADVGAPDGLGLSAVVRPLGWLRLNAGMTTNTVSVGVRGGASLVPLSTFIAPSLNFDVGHSFGGDYNQLVTRLGGTTRQGTSLIRDISYTWGSASLGLEVGPPDGWHIYLRGGYSYWDVLVENTEGFLRETTQDPDLTATPLRVRLTSPALKLGFLYFF